jgi:hypothetical protein
MPSKNLDIDASLKALAARGEKMKRAQRLKLGDLVLDTGAEKVFDADELKDLLRWDMVQLKVNPKAREEWRHEAEGAFPGANGKSAGVTSLPARAGAADLLSGAAAE